MGFRVGDGGLMMVKPTVLVVPPGAVTETFRVVKLAVAAMVNVAVTVVSFTTARLLTVTPLPETFTAVAPVRPLPVKVTGTAKPRTPEVGLIDVRDGASTVKVTLLPVPPVVVTVTFLELRPAFEAIVKVAVIVVLFTTTILLTVMPAPDTAIVAGA